MVKQPATTMPPPLNINNNNNNNNVFCYVFVLLFLFFFSFFFSKMEHIARCRTMNKESNYSEK